MAYYRFIGIPEKTMFASRMREHLENRGHIYSEQKPDCAIVLSDAYEEDIQSFLDRDVPCYQIGEPFCDGTLSCRDESHMVDLILSYLLVKDATR